MSTPAPSLAAQNIEDIYPLSPLQQGMLFHTLLHSDSGVYLMQDRYRIDGQIDHDAFLRGWQLVVAAHPALRTSFVWKTQKQPMQVVHQQVDVPVEFIDLRDRDPERQEAYIRKLLTQEQRQGFNLAKAPLIRFRLVCLGKSAYEFIRSFHHILMDAWCISLVTVDFLNAYEDLRQGRSPTLRQPRPYRDYIAWLRNQDKSEAQGFWQRQLAGLDAPTPLVIEKAPRRSQYSEAVLVDDALIRLDEPQSRRLTRFCQTHRITPNTFFQGAWALLLSRYSGNAEVIFGVTVAGRPPELAGVEEMIGLFINTLPLRVRLDEDEVLVPWLQALQGINLDMREFEHSTLTDIQGWSGLARGEALFDTILVYENAPIDASIFGGSLKFNLDKMEHSVHTHYGLTVVILPGERLGIRISYDRRRFDRNSIEHLLGHVRQLLLDMLANPLAPLKNLDLLTQAERRQLLLDWNRSEQAFPLEQTYAELFAAQVALRPRQTVAACAGTELSYAELDARASRLAAALTEAGAGPDTLVAVLAERGLALLTSLIAIFKAGAAYLPLDPNLPDARLRELLALSQAPVLAASSACRARAGGLAQGHKGCPLIIEAHWLEGEAGTPPATWSPERLAYVLFTSGSTGTPKGVMVEQRGMLNNIFGKLPADDSLGLSEKDVIAQTASQAFDISVWQLLAAPLVGARVQILPDCIAHDPVALLRAIADHGITLLEAVPAMIRGLLDAAGDDGDPGRLRWLIATGEALPPALANEWLERFAHVPLMNAYGPAECSDDVAFHALREGGLDTSRPLPVGKPTANNRLYILDHARRPQPVGVPGEIYIAGAGVGRGYWGDEEGTRRPFVGHPFSPGERIYRSGDLGRWLPDGTIEYLGRRDFQVKIRGHRIELGEIENRLEALPQVREAAVIARADARGEQQLVGYWVKQAQAQADGALLRDELGHVLPAYMVPALLIEIEGLPLNANGKVDRRQLARRELDWSATAREIVAPRNETEQRLYGIWAEILALETFSVEDSFFDLGGHSLLATQVISRIRAAFEIELPLKALFEHPTLALLAQAIDSRPGTENAAAPAGIHPPPRPGRIPLSFAQQRLWFIEQLNPGTAHFNIPFALRLQGSLDPQALRQSFRHLIERHEVLRTAFINENGEPCQRILDAVPFELPVTELDPPEDNGHGSLPPQILHWLEQPFDLGNPPLLRAQLLALGDNEHILAIALHHLVSDAWSATIALRELAQCYAALQAGRAPALAPLVIQYADFALWQREYLQGEVLERQLKYWKDVLAPGDGETGDYLLSLPTDKPRPAVQSYRSGILAARLPTATSERIRAFSSAQRQSPFSLVLAAFAVLLHRMSGQDDILLGTPVSNRGHAETQSLLGILLNNLAIRADFASRPSFVQVARQVGESLLEAQRHQDLPFEQLVDNLALPRRLSHAPLFQVMVAQQLAVERRLQFPGLSFEVLDTALTHSEYDLDLHVITPAEGPIELELMYALDLFEEATARRWLERFELLLDRLLENSDEAVAELPLLTPAEWRQTVIDWNRTEAEFPLDLTVHEAFEQQAARTPDAPAVVFEGRHLSYAELNARANRLAHYLRGEGVGPNTLVALCVERSLEMFVGIIGILKAGGAYVPLDPAHPSDRLLDVIEDARPAVVLTQQALRDRLPAPQAPVFCLDGDRHRLADLPGSNPINRTQTEDLVYVIYTSGSTGRPKGSLICHRSVINLAWARIEGIYRPLGAGRMRASFNYSFAFDASVAEFILLLDGHSLYITPEDLRFSPQGLVRFFKETRLDTFECTPAQLRYLIESGETAHLPRFVLFGGDAVDPQLWQRLHGIPNTVFFNTYGPTECSVDAIACRIESRLPKPVIGRPIANVRAYILDGQLNPLPVGVVGELHIGGEGVGQGYLNRPELTAEKFIPDPFSPVPGARMYKSGDLARFLPDGAIEYLGRVDHQVKIRGFRVELGEIETALVGLPAVREAVAIVREDRPGDQRLVAYLVTDVPEPDLDAIRTALKQRLPEYMIPSPLMVLDELPLTANGKIDRKALPKPDWHDTQDVIEPPRNAVERRMAQIWSEVLDVPADYIGRDANFFHLGGHSLLATVLFARIARHFESIPALRQLFERPTVAGLSGLVGGLKSPSAVMENGWQIIVPRERPDRLPLSFAQQRLWFLDQLSPGTAQYNVTSAIAFEGTLNIDWLRQALDVVVQRHEILRSRIVAHGEGAELVIDPAGPFNLPVETADADDNVWQHTMRQTVSEEAGHAFDLAQDRLIRARVVKRRDHAQALLLLTLHHCVADDWSIQVLSYELAEVYQALADQRDPQLPDLAIQYVDYSLWQREAAQQAVYREQLDYWKQALGGSDYVLNLPTDRPRATWTEAVAGSRFLTLPDTLVAQLRQYAQQQGVTLYMVLLAALKVLLSRYSHQQDIRVGTAVANRNLAEIQPLIGCFINTLVIKSEVTTGLSFNQFLATVKQSVLATQEHQDVPFEQVVEALAQERNLERTPLFQVMFTHQTASVETKTWPGLRLRELPVEMAAAKFDLDFEVYDDQRKVSLLLEYRKALFDDATMARWLTQWQGLLEQIAADPERTLAGYELLTAEERRLILHDWNRTAVDFPLERTYAGLFADRAATHPQRIAAVCQGETLSYAELNARANRLARVLIENGAGPDVVVALLAERGLPLLSMMIAVFKAGAAYLPLDVNHPPQRLTELLNLSGAAVMLAGDSSTGLLDCVLSGVTTGPQCLITESLWLEGEAPEPPRVGGPDDLAYVIFTSGSTGTPKGVMVEQRGMLNNIYGKVPAIGLCETDRLAQTAPVAFDISVWQFLAAPLLGATVHILPDALTQDPIRLLEAVDGEGITLMEVVPSVMRAMLDLCPPAVTLSSLRWLMSIGEALPPALCRRWFDRFPEVPLMNLYGPAECADNIGFYPITRVPEEDCLHMPIGRPTANNHLFVLDSDLRPVPIGVPGEICTAGAGVGRGYLNDPARTRQAFVAHPFQRGVRFYRTGDIGRYRPDGVIEYLGRQDHQVKVRGQRIELGEIESRLARHPAVTAAAVLALPDSRGDTRLIGYWQAKPDAHADTATLHAYLAAELPAFMVPAVLVRLDAMPLNRNGKLDRKALAARPTETADEVSTPYIAPRTATEARLAMIWSEILGLPQVGVEDNFFALGGHSLLAIVLLARIRQWYKVTPSLRQLFEHPTLAELAALTGDAREQSAQSLTPQPRPERLPLSFVQQRLWFLEQLDAESAGYNMTTAVEFSGPLQVDWLQRGLETIIARHEILRSRILEQGQGAELVIDACNALPLRFKQLDADDAGWERLLVDAANQETLRPFDLARDRLIRAGILQRRGHQQAVLLLTLHHTVADDWSMQLLIDELSQYYRACCQDKAPQLPPLPIQYVDYSLWQRVTAQDDRYNRQLDYWKRTLGDGDYLLELPTDYPRTCEYPAASRMAGFTLSPELSTQLRDYARRQEITPFTLTLALTQVLLGRLANQHHVRIGTTVSNRSLPETQALIGCFVNTLVITAELDPGQTFQAFLAQVKERLLEAMEHQDVPFDRVVDALAPSRNLDRTPLFQVMVAMQSARLDSAQWPDLQVREICADKSVANFDLSWDIHDDQRQISVRVDYCLALFKDDTITSWLESWQHLLSQVLNNPAICLDELDIGAPQPLLTPAERQRILIDWNRTELEFPRHLAIHQVFEQQVERTPDALAVVFKNQRLSYAELNARANRLAHYLRGQGVRPNTLVALCVGRSLDLFVGILGILKAGGAYVPIDPAYPTNRIDSMIADAQPEILLSQQPLLAHLSSLQAPVFCLDSDRHRLVDQPPHNPVNHTQPEDWAYVIYTSGSTGRPKGALIYHRSVVNLAWAHFEGIYRPLDTDPLRASFNHSFAFDSSVSEFILLLDGHTLYITPEELRLSPQAMVQFFKDTELDAFECTPAQLRHLIEADTTAKLPRVVIIGGEAIDAPLWQRLQNVADTVFFNAYGPTECTVDALICRIGPDLPKPVIGRPIANARAYVLDAHLNPLPVGVAGELHIGGEGVGYGYLNRPELTAEKFIADPFNPVPGARMYKSGDLARFLPDGTIEYLGRMDHQVKIRGFRVELGEIETALVRLPAVREAIALVREDRPGDQRLVAYLVAEDSRPDLDALRTALKQWLPEYMVPGHLVALDALPLTANGKIDRKALPKPDANSLPAPVEAPRGDIERSLARLWSEILDVPLDRIGRDANFFALGGDSILVLQLIARAKAEGFAITAKQLFQQRSLADLALVVVSAGHIETEQGILRGELPLLPIQHWFFEQNLANPDHWNQSMLLTPRERLHPDYLRAALHHLCEHHDALRMRFDNSRGGWRQWYGDIGEDCVLAELTLTPGETLQELLMPSAAGLRLQQGPLMQAALVALPDGQQRLYLAVHHLVVDLVSWHILLEDLVQLYGQIARGETPALPAKTSSYRQWSQCLSRYSGSAALLAQREYWMAQGGDRPLPVDYPDQPKLGADEVCLDASLTPQETLDLIQDAQKAYRTQVQEILLTALAQTLCSWKGDAALTIELESHGRAALFPEMDLSRTVGWFTNQYPVCLRLPEAADDGTCIKVVKEQLRAVPEHGLGYGTLRYLTQAKMPEIPPSVLFNYLGRIDANPRHGLFDLSSDAMPADRDGANGHLHELEVVPMAIQGVLRVEWRFNRRRFALATQERLLVAFMNRLRALIRHCLNTDAGGFTPADFPLAKKLNQKSLDKLLGKLQPTAKTSTEQ